MCIRDSYRVSLAFSPPAVGLTLVYFLFIYLFALLKGRRRIRRMKIRELIYLDRRNEEEVIEKSRSRRRIFVLSVKMCIRDSQQSVYVR